MLYYGYDDQAIQLTVSAQVSTYTLDDLRSCVAHSDTATTRFIHPGYFHTAVIQNAEPGRRIYYRVGGSSSSPSSLSEVFEHVGFPASSSIAFIYTADMGIGPVDPQEMGGALNEEPIGINSENDGPTSAGRVVVKAILENEQLTQYNFLLHNGDISYACGQSMMHEAFHAQVQPLASLLPYMTSVGNHEYDHFGQPFKPIWGDYGDDSGGDCGIPYRSRFKMPEPIPPAPNDTLTPFYSFELGVAHIVVLGLDSDFTPSSAQYGWLVKDLAGVNRAVTPWVIVAHHRQLYTSVSNEQEMNAAMRAILEPVYMKYSVDVVLSGHQHIYERFCPLFNGTCYDEGKAPTYILDGSAGAYLFCSDKPMPATERFRDCNFGYSRAFLNETTFVWEHIRQDTRAVIDSLVLTK